ncbi:methyltransferase domain-containing protein [Candidatus Dojkabacteria bacterium]|uniref:Methyltransferase domain-containing protein n=1 Tax=Candidatus Dojkabacteria bacterium TaxID=2099670 RepID=A0A955L994_9BACT|nr:methyltransferase domain-containing protein [Candidatus Dojkabacteria bacterium]
MKTKKRGKRFSKEVYTDEQSSFISNPEYVAQHIVETILDYKDFKSAVELCSCVGSTCIQLAKKIDKVIGIDSNPDRVSMARKNAELYEIDNVQFIHGDVLDSDLLKSIDADIALLDPGWSTRVMDRSSHVSDIDATQPSLRDMFNLTKQYVTNDIVARVPATFTCATLKELGNCKIENIVIDGMVVFKVAYFIGDMEECSEEDIVFE